VLFEELLSELEEELSEEFEEEGSDGVLLDLPFESK